MWGLCHGHFANPINVEDRRKIFKFYPAGITVEKGVVVCSLCWERHKNDIDKEPSVWEIVAGPKVILKFTLDMCKFILNFSFLNYS